MWLRIRRVERLICRQLWLFSQGNVRVGLNCASSHSLSLPCVLWRNLTAWSEISSTEKADRGFSSKTWEIFGFFRGGRRSAWIESTMRALNVIIPNPKHRSRSNRLCYPSKLIRTDLVYGFILMALPAASNETDGCNYRLTVRGKEWFVKASLNWYFL